MNLEEFKKSFEDLVIDSELLFNNYHDSDIVDYVENIKETHKEFLEFLDDRVDELSIE